jgi:hypothetical protein
MTTNTLSVVRSQWGLDVSTHSFYIFSDKQVVQNRDKKMLITEAELGKFS